MKSIVGTRPEAEQVLGLLFGNSKVSSHGEIDHGGGEIASIGTIVHERAGFGRGQSIRWFVEYCDGPESRVSASRGPQPIHHDEDE